MHDILSRIDAQGRQLDSLTAKVEKLLSLRRTTAEDGDRVDYQYIDSVQFFQQDLQARDIVFPIPEGTTFVGRRLSIYPFFRFVTTDPANNGPNEETFRPCIFSSNEAAYNPVFQSDAASVDLFVALSETYKDERGVTNNRAYQNMPFPVEFLRSSSVNYKRNALRLSSAIPPGEQDFDKYYAGFEFPSTFLFDSDYVLHGGSNLRVTIAPGFAGVRVDPAAPGADQSLQNEYKIVVVFGGKKVIRS